MRRLKESAYLDIYEAVREHTLVSEPAVRFYVNAALATVERKISGVIMECGCWFAGASLAVCLAQQAAFGKVINPVYLLDKFVGFEPPVRKDGVNLALFGRDRCGFVAGEGEELSDSLQEFLQSAAEKSVNLSGEAVITLFNSFDLVKNRDFFVFPGWIKDTFHEVLMTLNEEKIGLLRLDMDLYEATSQGLQFVPYLQEHGLVLVDDYYHFDGCSTAVHEYLAVYGPSYKIREMPGQGIWFEKRSLNSSNFYSEWPFEEKII